MITSSLEPEKIESFARGWKKVTAMAPRDKDRGISWSLSSSSWGGRGHSGGGTAHNFFFFFFATASLILISNLTFEDSGV